MKSIGSIVRSPRMEGEFIERKIERITANNEPISDGAEIIFQDRKDGVSPDYDVRTDRWEHAIEAMDVIAKTKIAKRKTVSTSTDDVTTMEGKGATLNTHVTEGSQTA